MFFNTNILYLSILIFLNVVHFVPTDCLFCLFVVWNHYLVPKFSSLFSPAVTPQISPQLRSNLNTKFRSIQINLRKNIHAILDTLSCRWAVGFVRCEMAQCWVICYEMQAGSHFLYYAFEFNSFSPRNSRHILGWLRDPKNNTKQIYTLLSPMILLFQLPLFFSRCFIDRSVFTRNFLPHCWLCEGGGRASGGATSTDKGYPMICGHYSFFVL